ncbi:MAG: acyl carrier protein [Thermocrispum sp.]
MASGEAVDAEFDHGYDPLALLETGVRSSEQLRQVAALPDADALDTSTGPDSAEFTLDDLKRILLEAAGEEDGAEVDPGALDVEFDQLGYESLAMLETGLRIEREFGIKLDDDTIFESATPRALIDAVNAHLTRRW